MTRIVLLLALGLIGTPALAQDGTRVPPGGDPAMACGQTAQGRGYWVEYAFCDLRVHGPGKAKGLVFWNHGVDGIKDSYQSTTPRSMRLLQQAGWDVFRINRNGQHETCSSKGAGGIKADCWNGGTRHVDDLIERTRQAQRQGYGRVVAAGQSLGGAIALEANARAPNLFYAVYATSPGHGSDAIGPTSHGAYYNLDRMLIAVIARQRNGRILVSLPAGDPYVPQRYNNPIGPSVRATLAASGLSFVLFDETMPITGHGAAATSQFVKWFGDCIRTFLDPGATPPAGETTCPPPKETAFVLPADLKVPMPGTSGPGRFLGRWEGAFQDPPAAVLVIVESVTGDRAQFVYARGAGSNRDKSMGSERVQGRIEGDRLVVERNSGRKFDMKLEGDNRLSLTLTTATGLVWTATLSRAAGGNP